jgi:hypothetical protein
MKTWKEIKQFNNNFNLYDISILAKLMNGWNNQNWVIFNVHSVHFVIKFITNKQGSITINEPFLNLIAF